MLPHHVLDYSTQCSPLDVLCDEVQPFVLVEYPDKPQHVGMLQTPHHLHLGDKSTVVTAIL